MFLRPCATACAVRIERTQFANVARGMACGDRRARTSPLPLKSR